MEKKTFQKEIMKNKKISTHCTLCWSRTTVDCKELLVLSIVGLCVSGYLIYLMSLNSSLTKFSDIEPKKVVRAGVNNMCEDSDLLHFANRSVDFRGFNNYTGYPSGCYMVSFILIIIFRIY